MITQDNDTDLVIVGLGIPRWAARGLTQTLTPIEQARQVTRDINGRSMNLGQVQFQKYATTITCTDQRTPAFDGIWPGEEVVMDCIAELCYPLYGTPQRAVVEGSERQEGEYIFYRPILQMVFLGFNTSTPEWEGRVTWQMEFEEV